MKKLMKVAAILALVLVAAAPAMAQEVTNAVGQEDETGDVSLNFTATQSGSNSNQCVTPEQFANTASLQNGQAVLQYVSDSGDIGEGGSTFTFSPSETVNCTGQVQQSAAASG